MEAPVRPAGAHAKRRILKDLAKSFFAFMQHLRRAHALADASRRDRNAGGYALGIPYGGNRHRHIDAPAAPT